MPFSPIRRFSALLGVPALLIGVVAWAQPVPHASLRSGARYADHPPLAHTGGFGEPTCRACHFGEPVNGGDGTLRVRGLPEPVSAGQTYDVSVVLEASMERAGFMLSIRGPDGEQAGFLQPVDTARVGVRTVDSTGVAYAHHMLDGTELTGEQKAVWQLNWTAPDTSLDSVTVHVAANAANHDASEFGDDVYSTVLRRAVNRSD